MFPDSSCKIQGVKVATCNAGKQDSEKEELGGSADPLDILELCSINKGRVVEKTANIISRLLPTHR